MTLLRPSDSVVRIGTRASKLALWQSEHVAHLIEASHPEIRCELIRIVTRGDRHLDRPLPEIGGKGLFTAEIEGALRQGEIDIAVHSLKDLPVDDAPGLAVGAVLSREAVRDVLVARNSWTLETLPPGAVVGTSSLRRQAQLLAYRRDLAVRPIRGNVDTRIRKVLEGEYHAAVLAGAGLRRLGLDGQISQWLALDVMLPAPGQGALGVQCRADDAHIRALLAAISEPAVEQATQAERHLLWLLGGGCSAPIAAYAEVAGDGVSLLLRARVANIDGTFVAEAGITGTESDQVAAQVAAELRRQVADQVLAARTLPALAGKRVVVTRPKPQAEELAALLREQGAEAILAPSAQIEGQADSRGLDDALERLDQYAWLLFTSANAVEAVCARPGAQSLRERRPPGLGVAAVGPASAAALAERGIQVDFVPSQAHGDALVAELPLAPGDAVLLPRSAIGRAQVREQLAARGARVDDIAVYTTTAAPPAADSLEMLRQGWDTIIFTSGSTARGFVAAAAEDAQIGEHLQRSVIVCIGPVTATAVRELGYTPQLVAAEHTAAGIVAALVEHYARS